MTYAKPTMLAWSGTLCLVLAAVFAAADHYAEEDAPEVVTDMYYAPDTPHVLQLRLASRYAGFEPTAVTVNGTTVQRKPGEKYLYQVGEGQGGPSHVRAELKPQDPLEAWHYTE
jgi:uncharacterized protein YdeI (BOF family)